MFIIYSIIAVCLVEIQASLDQIIRHVAIEHDSSQPCFRPEVLESG